MSVIKPFGPAPTTVAASGATVHVDIRTEFTYQKLKILEVRPNLPSNDYDIHVYKDMDRLKKIYSLVNITDDEFIFVDSVELYLLDETLHFSIVNNAAGPRSFIIEGLIEGIE